MAYTKVAFALAGAGMNTKVEDTLLSPPAVKLAYNTYSPKTGGFAKRKAYSQWPATGDIALNSISTAEAMAAYKDTAVWFTGSKLYEYSTGATRWIDKGAAVVNQLTVTGVECPSEFTPVMVDVGVTSTGYSVYASLVADSASVYYVDMTIVDSNGTTVGRRRLATLAGAAYFARVAQVGARVWIVWGDGNNLQVFVADCTSSTTVNTTLTVTAVVTADTVLNGYHDVAPRPVAGDVLVAYPTTTAGQVKWGFLSTSGTLGSTSTYATGVTPVSCACCVETSEAMHGIVYIDSANPNDVYALHRSWNGAAWTATASSGALDTALAANPIWAACRYDDATTLRVFYSEVTTSMRTYQATYTTAGVASSRTVTLRHTWLASKPFRWNSTTYFWGWQCGSENPASPYSKDDPTLFLFSASDGIPVARALPGTAIVNFVGLGPPAHATVSTNTLICAMPEMQRVYDVSASLLGGLAMRRIAVEFNSAENYRIIETEGTLQIPGAIVKQYDGAYVTESGFLRFATENSWSAGRSGGGGGLANPGTYFYQVIPEWTNARGERELGTSTGSKSFATVAANDTGVITIDTISATLKQGSTPDIIFGVYRTADPTTASADSVFYRVGQVVNNPSADTVTFNDTMSDSNAILQEQLYLGTGELDNVSFPPCHIIASGNGRVAVAGAENPNTIYVSKYRADGRALEHNDALVIQCPSDGGDIVALAWLNQTLIIFKERLVYYVRGDGPNNLGQGAFSEPELLSSDTGCLTQHSVVLTPMGLMFQGQKGIMLLDQGYQVSYIGAPIENPSSPAGSIGTVVDAVCIPIDQRVHFSDGSRTFVYDYYHKQWHIWSFATNGPGCVYQNQHAGPYNNTVVYQNRSGSTLQDVGTSFTTRVDLAFMASPSSPLENIRIRKVGVLGEVTGTSVLSVSFAYDSTSTSSQTIDETAIAAGALRRVLRPARQVTNQFRVILSDTSSGGTYTTSAGSTWTSITFEVQPVGSGRGLIKRY